ncbi:uncharacterized protein LOC114248301 isoform X3 [Bombyx mandarina]|uniref:Uncharacterized protein LOC114248301 isoform X1 n=1 Tax=Bombyx mandarina TaxID=7092 RepID=A0A6J2K6R3_BOMMA|nr:uncharacterized protein LOC114248301 isoform X1 [Bombyx mandarina]XP_028037309.1 uncharacterized protein LOC114248301 isoform X2 [Bombyx mandarina]XP_028037310.1 uncharacterized protein LOC114248301 isoform X3 [Bombyx mandarina]
MKKVSSVVWRFFERIEENKRCVSVVCKLCENQYKYFGNTTNLRVHLTNKHPIQWELTQNGTLDESNFRFEDGDSIQSSSTPQKRKYTPRGSKNVRYSVSIDNNEESTGTMPTIDIQRVNVLENSDLEEEDNDATINLVKQMHGSQQSDEDWLVDDPYEITHIETYEPKPKRKKMKYRPIKREVQSPTGLPGFYVAPKSDRKIIYEESKRQDEYTVFGEYIANKLRKFKMPKTRGNLQQLITTILWQAEYGMYDSADSVKRVLMHSVQTNTSESCTVEFVAQDSINEQVLHDSNENQCLESETLEAETE